MKHKVSALITQLQIHPLLSFFPLLLLYYELAFETAIYGTFTVTQSTLLMALFSLAYGGILYLISTLSRSKAFNRMIGFLLTLGSAVPYLIEYFVYRQFKVYYDLNTMTGGAGDALTEFAEEVKAMVFSPAGLTFIGFMILPAILFLGYTHKTISTENAGKTPRILAALSAVAAYGVSLALIMTSPVFGPLYGAEYNFQSAVSEFGLMTGLRLDVKNNLMGGSDSFEVMNPEDETGEAIEIVPTTYGFNEMDIDFEALAATSTGQIQDLHKYVATLRPSRQNEYTGLFAGKNLIMISAEAFTEEVIDPVLTPTLYRLANKGIQFTDYYQPSSAGTTGGEYQNVFSFLPTAGGKSFKMTADHLNYFTMGSQLDRLGYYGKAYHNNWFEYYDRHLTHTNLGYSDGYMGMWNGMEEFVSDRWPQSDLEMIAGTLPTYINKQPFNIYYMSVSGHSNYSRSGNSMTKKNWDRVAHLECSDVVKGYYAANLELEDALTHLVNELEAYGIADDTVICISTDHFPYGLHDGNGATNNAYLEELYGYPVTDRLVRDHNRLILWSGCLEDMEPIIVDTPTSSLDIVPTLSNLFGTEFDSRLFPGRDVFSNAEALMFNLNYDWKTDKGSYNASTGKFTPNEGVVIPEEYYDDYIKRIKSVVRNKVNYCRGVLETDYFRVLFENWPVPEPLYPYQIVEMTKLSETDDSSIPTDHDTSNLN